MGLYMIILV